MAEFAPAKQMLSQSNGPWGGAALGATLAPLQAAHRTQLCGSFLQGKQLGILILKKWLLNLLTPENSFHGGLSIGENLCAGYRRLVLPNIMEPMPQPTHSMIDS